MGWLGDLYNSIFGGSDARGSNEFRDVDPYGSVGGYATEGQKVGALGQQGYLRRGQSIDDLSAQLGRLARGEDSYSQEQLRQATNRNIGQQLGIAASARPGNSAMAARMAAQNSADLGAQAAQAQALAGIQERSSAQQALSNLLLGARGQDVQYGLGGMGLGLQGALGIEQQRGNRFNALMGEPTGDEKMMAGIRDVATIASLSDRNLKTNISDGGGAADRFMESLRPYEYNYKQGAGATWPYPGGPGDPPSPRPAVAGRYTTPYPLADGGELPRERMLGVMAQDLERSKIGAPIVNNTPQGKMVETAKLASALAAATARLNERLKKVEKA